MIQIPSFNTYPRDFLPLVYKLQKELLAEAEHRYGPRNIYVSLGCPIFSNDPQLDYSQNDNKAFIKLGPNSADSWPAAVQELAHEVVHMLNPDSGHTNYLEEGLAEVFSEDMAREYLKNYNQQRAPFDPYDEAKRLVKILLTERPDAPKKLREICSLKELTPEIVLMIVPKLPRDVANKLTSICITR